MNNAAFLLVAIGFSVVVSLAIWAFNRKPKTFMSSIDDFEREMRALGRDPEPPGRGRGPSVQPMESNHDDHDDHHDHNDADTADPAGAPEEHRP